MQQRDQPRTQQSRIPKDGKDRGRLVSAARVLGFAGALGAGFLAGFGCDGGDGAGGDVSEQSNLAALAACHLNDGSVEPSAHLHACDPSDHHKTTICHIPPGNPANAHTLCIGNAAVPAHLQNHGDTLGACKQEQPCPPPPPPGGTSGAAGSGDGQPETPPPGGAAGAGGSSGSGGAGGAPIIIG
jgi:hypothetical protein